MMMTEQEMREVLEALRLDFEACRDAELDALAALRESIAETREHCERYATS